MPGNLHLRIHLGDVAVFVDQERGALDAPVFFAVHVLFLPDAVLLADRVLFVGEQDERQLVFRDELLMLLHRVRRDAEDHGVRVRKRRMQIAEAAGLRRASRRTMFLCT